MPWTFDNALDDEFIEIVDRNDEMGSYAIRLGDLETTIFIELGRFPKGEWTKFDVSHAIHTPLQMGPYRTSRPFSDDPPYALHQAISGLTQYYGDAIRAGHTPEESWLVENRR